MEGLRQASKFVSLNFNRAPSLTCPYVQDKLFVLDVLLDLISELLTDIPKDVIGQVAHEGDTEGLEEEKEFDAEEQEAGHPETAVVLGETERGISETPEGSDIPILTVSDHYTCQILSEEGLIHCYE